MPVSPARGRSKRLIPPRYKEMIPQHGVCVMIPPSYKGVIPKNGYAATTALQRNDWENVGMRDDLPALQRDDLKK
jgi:hypothetical protein